MPYPTLPGRAHPYNVDGTVVKYCTVNGLNQTTLSSGQRNELNDEDYTLVQPANYGNMGDLYLIFFFPEMVELQGLFAQMNVGSPFGAGPVGPSAIYGSQNSTNGFDGTWEAAAAPSGYNSSTQNFDTWWSGVKVHSFSQKKNVIRILFAGGFQVNGIYIAHLYAKKGASETPDDILFLDAQASDGEFAVPLNFGDQPAGTTVVRQIKLKNDSPTKQANDIDIQLTSPYFTIGESDTGPWETQLTLSSLASGAKSSIYYVKCTTPTPPTDYKPVRSPLYVTVDSWS